MYKTSILFYIHALFWCSTLQAKDTLNYSIYHHQVVEIETLIASENYTDAFFIYENIFEKYDFIFLRDYQIATQLALFLGDEQKAKQLLIKGIQSGWAMKSIKQNAFLDNIRKREGWKFIKKQYRQWNKNYRSSINQNLRTQVQKMYSKDQRKALGALLRFSSKAQDKYAERKFAPHSENQINEFLNILSTYGYPGEKLIGNEYWMSTILSHHNSISRAYNKKDTLYKSYKPKLKMALVRGDISAFSYVMIEEWYRAVVKDTNFPTFGILDEPLQTELSKTNEIRKGMYLRSVEVHNKLVDIEEKTGMNFYLDGHPWDKRKIEIR